MVEFHIKYSMFTGMETCGGYCLKSYKITAAHLRQLVTSKGSVAQIVGDSLGDSKVLVAGYEQTCTSDLPHDELALLQRRPEAAWLAADLV